MILPIFQSIFSPEKTFEILLYFIPQYDGYTIANKIGIISTITICIFLLKMLAGIAQKYHSRNFTQILRADWVNEIGKRYLFGMYGTFVKVKQGELLNNWFTEKIWNFIKTTAG